MGFWKAVLTIAVVLLAGRNAEAAAVYYSAFNIEGESAVSATYVTYATLADMLNDTNRTGAFHPDDGGAQANVVGTGSDGTTFWALFNIEGESAVSASYVTYATLADMLNDSNRTGVFHPDSGGAQANAVGTGSDGTTFWALFNIEGESAVSASYVTYATLADMLNDSNRTGVFHPNDGGAQANVVGTDSDGTTFWSLFNIEGESAVSASYVTYATLADMLNDANRTGVFHPNDGGAQANVVGTGAFFARGAPPPVPEPSSILLLLGGIALGIRKGAIRR